MSNSSSLKSKAILKEQQRAQERRNNRNGFTSRNYWVYVIFSFIVLPLGMGLSIWTEAFNYVTTWAAPLGNWRWFVALFVALITNVLVVMMGKGVTDDIQDAVFSGETFDKFTFVLKVLLFCGAAYWSVSNSLAGAPALRTSMKVNRQPVADLLDNPDNINAAYAERRQQQLDIIAAAKRTTWKNNITRDAMRAMRTAQAELKTLDAAISAERSAVTEANAATTLAYNEETKQQADGAWAIAGVGQIVMGFCIIFIGLWNTGVEHGLTPTKGADAGAGAGSGSGGRNPIGFGGGLVPTSQTPTPPPGSAPGHNLPAPRRQIGFGTSHPTPPSGGGTVPVTPFPGGNPAVATRSYGAETPDPDSLEARSRLAAWTKHNAQMNAYRAKKETPSALAGIDRQQELMNHEEQELARMGMRIELQESPRKVYILVQI